MKILVVPAVDWLSSLQNRLHFVVNRLAERHEVHVLEIELSRERKRESGPVKIHRPPTIPAENIVSFYSANLMLQFATVLKVLKQEEIDLLLTSNLFAGSTSILAARASGVKSVFDYADYLPSYAQYLSAPEIVRAFGRGAGILFNDYNIKKSDLVVACGFLLQQYASRLQSRVVYIPNGADSERFNPRVSGKLVRNRLGIADEDFVVGFLGHISFWVDTDLLVEGFKMLLQREPRARLLIVGTAAYDVSPRIRSLSDRAMVTGYIPHAEIPDYIAAMDVCTTPFKLSFETNAGIPIKMHEYAACGKPVVSTPLYEIIERYGASVFYARDGREMCAALETLARDDELRQSTGMELRRVFERNFSWSILTKKYEDALLSII